MVRLLSTITLVLALVLFPPAALALVSNNAVPGDASYPIKRVLEDVIFTVASLNPVSKAWFAAARSDRRFKEFTTLVIQGKKGEETLNELVEQTQIAANQINQVKDDNQKQKLIQQLSESIKKYDQGLQQLSPQSQQPQPTLVPVATATPLPQATPVPQEVSTPIPAPIVPPQPVPTIIPTPIPTSIPTAYPTPNPTVVPAPNPTVDADRQRQIEEARRRLEEIQRRLKERKQENEEDRSHDRGIRQQVRQERKENEAKDDFKDRPRRGKD